MYKVCFGWNGAKREAMVAVLDGKTLNDNTAENGTGGRWVVVLYKTKKDSFSVE